LNADGSWDVDGNWDIAGFPDHVNDDATLGNTGSVDQTLTLGRTISLNSLTINDDNQYTITGSTLQLFKSGTSFVQDGTGTAIINSAIVLKANMTFGGVGSGTVTLNGAISGAKSFTKDGSYTIVLNAANSYSGSTTISGGTLEVSAAGALTSTTSISIGTGGTLLLSGSTSADRIGNTVGISLSGGSINGNNMTETMGALTLVSSSSINLGSNASQEDLTFSSGTYTAGTLTVNGWTGNAYTSGTGDRIFFATDPGTTFLSNVQFTGYSAGAVWLSATQEVVPIPEPWTVASGGLIFLMMVWRSYSRLGLGLVWKRIHF
jgi:autotransporter-associated beta strand protein